MKRAKCSEAILVKMPRPLRRAVEQAAAAEGRPLSAFVRRLLEAAVGQ
jgi:predicted DNA binding CopG/RHH family protein